MNAMMKIDADAGEIADVRGVLTEKQALFVRAMVDTAGNVGRSAELAGLDNKYGWTLTKLPHVQHAIRAERERELQGKGACVALATMMSLMTDQRVSGAVRFQAAKWTLEAAGHGLSVQRAMLGLPPQDKPLSEMTLDELDAFISAGKAATTRLRDERDRTIEGRVVRDDVRSNGADSAQVADSSGMAEG